jgi:hypothetical protein
VALWEGRGEVLAGAEGAAGQILSTGGAAVLGRRAGERMGEHRQVVVRLREGQRWLRHCEGGVAGP